MPTSFRHLGLLAAAALAMATAACDTLNLSRAGMIASTVTAELSPAAASVMAAEMVGQLLPELPPNGSPVALRSDGSAFGLALEEALRTAGYAVTSDSRSLSVTAIPLAYSVDALGDAVLVRLSSPMLELTRMYTVTRDTVTPSSPVSILRRDEAGQDE